MNHLVDVVLLGACLFYARRLFGKRPAAQPTSIAEARPEPTVPPSSGRSPPKIATIRAPAARPVAAAPRSVPPGYLLGGPCANGGIDRTTAMMDMISGPGVCTPRDR